MRTIIFVMAMAIAVPLSVAGSERGYPGLEGVREGSVMSVIAGSGLETGYGAAREQERRLQFHLALGLYFSIEDDMQEVIDQPMFGVDAGMIFWFADPYGLGIEAQFSSGSGEGEVDDIDIELDMTYTNVFVNLYSRLYHSQSLSLYFLTGIGYSNVGLEGEARMGMLRAEEEETYDGVCFQAGIGLRASYVFGEIKYLESSFDSDYDDVEIEEKGIQLVIGMRV